MVSNDWVPCKVLQIDLSFANIFFKNGFLQSNTYRIDVFSTWNFLILLVNDLVSVRYQKYFFKVISSPKMKSPFLSAGDLFLNHSLIDVSF